MITNEYYENTDKIEQKILEIILASELNFYECMGLLDHIKLELHRIINQEIDSDAS